MTLFSRLDTSPDIPAPYRVPAVTGAVALLDALAQTPGTSLSELARRCGLSKSTAHNLLATLEHERFVARDPRTLAFALGPRLVPLGAAAARGSSRLSLALDHVAPLAAACGLSFAVAQATDDEQVQVLERFYPPSGVHVGVTRGSRYGAFDGALGKCLLATLDDVSVHRLLAKKHLPAHTALTITDPAELLEEIALVRERGWGASARELNENNAVAAFVPADDAARPSEIFLLALGFTTQLGDERIPAVGALLAGTARAIAAGQPAPTAAPVAAERLA